jgi:hypothetical protein
MKLKNIDPLHRLGPSAELQLADASFESEEAWRIGA